MASILGALPPFPGILVSTRLPNQGPAVSSSYLYDERVWPLASLHQRQGMLRYPQHVARLLPHLDALLDQSAANQLSDTGRCKRQGVMPSSTWSLPQRQGSRYDLVLATAHVQQIDHQQCITVQLPIICSHSLRHADHMCRLCQAAAST